MRKALMLLVVGMLALPIFGWAQTEKKGVTVAGVITFKKTGDIHLNLLTAAEFDEHETKHSEQDKAPSKDKQDNQAGRVLLLKIGDKEVQEKKVAFAFENVPPGVYAIQGFQDVNGNGKLDEGTFGPKEPWGGYRSKRPKFRGPKFDEVQFEVVTDMTDIQLEMK